MTARKDGFQASLRCAPGLPAPTRLVVLASVVAACAVVFSSGRAGAQIEGAVQTYDDASLAIFGDNSFDDFRVAAVGDFNGDGAPDLALAASFFEAPDDTANGRIYLIPGPLGASGGPGASPVVRADMLATNSFVGETDAAAGSQLAAGDVDGDGLDDILWRDDADVAAIRLLPGRADLLEPGAPIQPLHIRTPSPVFHVDVGDLDGDGFDDVVYGSPLLDGEVAVLFGPLSASEGAVAVPRDTAVIRGPAGSSFGFAVAVGDVSGNGQADLAINLVGEDGATDLVSVLAGPFRPGTHDFDAFDPMVTTEDSLGIVDLAIGDVDLDGRGDLLISRPSFDEVRLLPGRVLINARFPVEEFLTAELYAAADPIDFGDRIAVADYDGDGLPDLLVGSRFDAADEATPFSGSVVGFAGADRSARIAGVRVLAPTVAELEAQESAASSSIEIHGQGFVNPTLQLHAADGTEFEVIPEVVSLGVLRAAVPAAIAPGSVDVVVLTDLGEARLDDAFVARPTTRTIELVPGWNLIGWTGATSVEDALTTLSPSPEALYTWDPIAQTFASFRPSQPAGNSLSDLAFGDGVWIYTAAGGQWEQPGFSEARSVFLHGGFNLVMWTGPNGTPPETAIADIADRVDVLFTWEPATRAFLRHRPGIDPSRNDPMAFDFGDGVWINMLEPAIWAQPAAAGDGDELAVATTFREVESGVVLVSDEFRSGSGFIVSETQILTNAHVVGGAASVTVRFRNGEEQQGLVTAIDGPLDVAVVEVATVPPDVRRLDWESAEIPPPGADLWIWGFPGGLAFGPDTAPSLSRGIVSAIQTQELFGETFSDIQTDAAINPGNSGGPVVLADGRVVGMSDFAVLFFGVDVEGLNFAIGIPAHRDRIRALLNQ